MDVRALYQDIYIIFTVHGIAVCMYICTPHTVCPNVCI
jgi:hypothetical protein